MKKACVFISVMLLLHCVCCAAQAAQKLNIYIDKEAILAHDISAADIRIRPEGMARVTRYSLWPWDEAGTKWSMFVELENTSDGKIVIDEDWLIACKANRNEIEAAEYIFDYTTNILAPGEKTTLYAGAYPYVQTKRNNADAALDVWEVEGMEDFASRIRQAPILRVRLDVRGSQSTQNWPAVEIEPDIRIAGRTIHFEWTNDTDETIGFRTIGAVVCDREGRMMDVVRSTYSRGAVCAPGETLAFEKELPPYITQEMMDGASFEAFAFRFPQPL